MESLLPHLLERGYAVLFVLVFLESIGIPVPAALALLIAGGACGQKMMDPVRTLATGIGAMMLGDILTFLVGRYTGWWLLGLLCRVSLNPESCILKSADAFYRRGRSLLLFAKFVPGINSLAAPVAGSMNMRASQFLALDFIGVSAYVVVYWGLGFAFSGVLQKITAGYESFGRVLAWIFGAALLSYVAYLVWARVKARRHRFVPRAQPSMVARSLYSPDRRDNVVVYDVRSHGYYEQDAQRIQNSTRLEPNALHQYAPDLFEGKLVFLYCTCIREATSALVAYLLRSQGIQCYVIEGGLRAWKKEGLPLESVPKNETIVLPSFAI